MITGARIVASLGKHHSRMSLVSHVVAHPRRLLDLQDERIALRKTRIQLTLQQRGSLILMPLASVAVHRSEQDRIHDEAPDRKHRHAVEEHAGTQAGIHPAIRGTVSRRACTTGNQRNSRKFIDPADSPRCRARRSAANSAIIKTRWAACIIANSPRCARVLS